MWDPSYGIVFGPPSAAQPGQFSPPRTFKRPPSSQFRTFSVSSKSSLPPKPSLDYKQPPKRRSTVDPSDPFALVSNAPRSRPQRSPTGTHGETKESMGGGRQKNPSILTLGKPVPIVKFSKRVDESSARLEVIVRDSEKIRNVAKALFTSRSIEIRNYENQLESVGENIKNFREVSAYEKFESYKRDSAKLDSIRDILQEVRKSLNVSCEHLAAENVKSEIREVDEIIDVVRRCGADYDKIIDARNQHAKWLEEGCKTAERELQEIASTVSKIQDEVVTWRIQRWEDQYRSIQSHLRKTYEFYDDLQKRFDEKGRSHQELEDFILETLEHKQLHFSKTLRDTLDAFRNMSIADEKPFANTAHEYRRYWWLLNGLKASGGEPFRLKEWYTYCSDERSVLAHYQKGLADIAEKLDLPFKDQFKGCLVYMKSVMSEHSGLMEEITKQYVARQPPAYRKQHEIDQPFGALFSSVAVENGNLKTVTGDIGDIIKAQLQNHGEGSRRKQLEDLRKYVVGYRNWLRETFRPQFGIIYDEFLWIHLSRLGLESVSKINEETRSADESNDGAMPQAEDKSTLRQDCTRDSNPVRDCERGVIERLEKLFSKPSQSWMFNPLVWENLRWDISIRTQDEIGNARLLYVLRQEKIISTHDLVKILNTKESILRIAAETVQLAQNCKESGDNSVFLDKEQVFLQSTYLFFQTVNEFSEAVNEKRNLPWITDETREKIKGFEQGPLLIMRKQYLRFWNTILELNLERHGLDVLSHYHGKDYIKKLRMQPMMHSANRISTSDDVEPSSNTQIPTVNDGTLSFQRVERKEASYWDYTQYAGSQNERVRVHYCTSRESTQRVVQKYFASEKVVGFDMEWKANASSSDPIKDNVSLIQVASEKRIGLFQVARYGKQDTVDDLVAPALKSLMESPNVIKTGVNIKGDCTRLRKHLGIESRGLFELSYLYKLVKYSPGDINKINKKPVKLSDQVEEHLGLPLWKGDVRSSDWTEKLIGAQQLYAASDPYACLHLYDVLESKRRAINPMPPQPEFAELNKPILLANGQPVSFSRKADEDDGVVESVKEIEPVKFARKDEVDTDSVSSSSLDWETAQILEETMKDEDSSEQAGRAGRKKRQQRQAREKRMQPTLAPRHIEMYSAASTWVEQYLRSNSWPPDISKFGLVGYALWHREGLTVHEICALQESYRSVNKRQGPARTTRVILKAISTGKLPCDQVKLDQLCHDLDEGHRQRRESPQSTGTRSKVSSNGPGESSIMDVFAGSTDWESTESERMKDDESPDTTSTKGRLFRIHGLSDARSTSKTIKSVSKGKRRTNSANRSSNSSTPSRASSPQLSIRRLESQRAIDKGPESSRVIARRVSSSTGSHGTPTPENNKVGPEAKVRTQRASKIKKPPSSTAEEAAGRPLARIGGRRSIKIRRVGSMEPTPELPAATSSPTGLKAKSPTRAVLGTDKARPTPSPESTPQLHIKRVKSASRDNPTGLTPEPPAKTGPSGDTPPEQSSKPRGPVSRSLAPAQGGSGSSFNLRRVQSLDPPVTGTGSETEGSTVS